MIATNLAGLKTITFSQPVTDVYLAILSWNANQSATFSSPFTIFEQGAGYFGSGTGTVTNGGLTLTTTGEETGILHFSGTITSLSYTDTVNEFWHGIQIGIGSVATSAVPEPSTWVLMIIGFFGIGWSMRRARPRPSVRYYFA